MGFRFQKRISILPGLRINLSKSGASASVGPRGADVNIGRNGVTTNAGIPGTGLSYRSRLGTHGSWLGVVLLPAGLAFWAGKHIAGVQAPVNSGSQIVAGSGAAPASSAAIAEPGAR